VLQRLELKHHSQLDTLRTLMHNSAVRLENSEGATVSASSPAEEDNARNEAVKWVYVAQSEYPANVDVQTAIPGPMKKWKSFVAGMGTMLVISALHYGVGSIFTVLTRYRLSLQPHCHLCLYLCHQNSLKRCASNLRYRKRRSRKRSSNLPAG
jgi:hypothetical protein